MSDVRKMVDVASNVPFRLAVWVPLVLVWQLAMCMVVKEPMPTWAAGLVFAGDMLWLVWWAYERARMLRVFWKKFHDTPYPAGWTEEDAVRIFVAKRNEYWERDVYVFKRSGQ